MRPLLLPCCCAAADAALHSCSHSWRRSPAAPQVTSPCPCPLHPAPVAPECANLISQLLDAGSGAPGAPEAVAVGELVQPEQTEVTAEAVVRALLDAGVLALRG